MQLARSSGVVAVLGLLVACGESAADRARNAPLVAGGETSEFSGGEVAGCSTLVSDTPVDLESADFAPWLALVRGRHELTLGWNNSIQTSAITGFDKHTSLSLDVAVLSARDVAYGPSSEANPAAPSCAPYHNLEIELAVTVETGDGSLRGSIRHWVSPRVDASMPGQRALVSMNLVGTSPLAEVGGALELGVAPERVAVADLRMSLVFEPAGVHGWFTPSLSLVTPSADVFDTWAPLFGVFPDDGCSPLRPIPLDEPNDSLGETPRAVYERAAERWRSAPIAAVWSLADWSLPLAERMLRETEIQVEGGAPTHACEGDGSVTLHAPLTIRTTDGQLEVTQPLQALVFRSGDTYVDGMSNWMQSADFAAATGAAAPVIGDGEYGAVRVRHGIDYDEDELKGWVDFLRSAHPDPIVAPALSLRWCTGAGCAFLWCIWTTDGGDAGCQSLYDP